MDRRDKWAVTRSKPRLFLPESKSGHVGSLIVEEPTDTAAAVDLGYNVIGRPACLGCEDMIAEIVKSGASTTVYIVADNDAPGQRDAK